MTENTVKTKSFQFALHVMDLFRKLETEKEFIISKQLLRAGSSIGANVQEALAAQSRKDFLHKMSIASKEARETLYWIDLLRAADWSKTDLTNSKQKAHELVKLLTAIVKTTSRSSSPIKN